MFNLQRLRRMGIPCPEPVLLKKHILFLSFIGKDTVPAQRLRDVILSPEELVNAYQQCLNVRNSSASWIFSLKRIRSFRFWKRSITSAN